MTAYHKTLIVALAAYELNNDSLYYIYSCLKDRKKELLPILESEFDAAINWLRNNKMIVNPDKFQVILLDKLNSNNTNIKVKIGNKKNKLTSSV